MEWLGVGGATLEVAWPHDSRRVTVHREPQGTVLLPMFTSHEDVAGVVRLALKDAE
ncbi:MAG: hypothetical protein MHM6MM_007345, partial [Cercozoa sp. M6MM]